MYTYCPDCNQEHTLTTHQLREQRGMLKCTACATLFDALIFISDQPQHNLQQAEPDNFMNVEQAKADSKPWTLFFLLGIALLTGQIWYFESYNLTQHQQLRPWLNHACQYLKCTLPVYRNTGEINLLGGQLEKISEHHYRFSAVLQNQAEFAQPYPAIELSLQDFAGRTFASRTFDNRHFQQPALLNSEENQLITLDIAAPTQQVGGYYFNLI